MTEEEKTEEYVSPKIWGDTYYVNCCGDWTNEIYNEKIMGTL